MSSQDTQDASRTPLVYDLYCGAGGVGLALDELDVEYLGVVVYFTKDGEQMAAACDRWDNPRDNAQDLYHYLHETRMQEQRGTVTAESEYQKLRLPSGDGDAVVAKAPAHEVLGVAPDAPRATVKGAYRELLKERHPDHGGTEAEFHRLQEAKEAMLDG